jgi:hypothetical protein
LLATVGKTLLSHRVTKVYCDASISPADMTSPLKSKIGENFVGRILMLSPDLDFGRIERVSQGLLTKDGNPASQQLELTAIARTLEVISKIEKGNFAIFSDNIQAVELAKFDNVKFLPSGEFHPASAFLERIMGRAKYLRTSSRKVTSRAPLTPIQKEIYDYFQSEEVTFKLSESFVWQKILSELAKSG